MKKKKQILSIILAVSIVLSGASAVGASAAYDIGKTVTNVGVGALEVIIKGILGGLAAIIPDDKNFGKVKDYVSESASNYFYKGTDSFLSEKTEESKWSLGYSQASLVPSALREAIEGGDKKYGKTNEYYLGGFMTLDNLMTNNVEEIIDDMRVRVIALEDGSGRGTSVFANVDCIGFCHGDLVTVRKYLKQLCDEDTTREYNLNAVNLTSTHCHSCIDTQGLWTDGFRKILGNMAKSYIPFLDKEAGVNEEWLDWACKEIAVAMKAAIDNQTTGELTYAVKTVNSGYFSNKNRKSSTSHCYDIYRFVFTPDDSNIAPTMMVNMNAHPDVTGLATGDEEDNGRQISGDYIYWMGDTIEKAGYNFMFFQGAIAGIYYSRGLTNDGVDLERRYMQAQRYGREMGKIALSMTMTYDEVRAKYEKEIDDEIAAEKAKRPDYDENSYTRFYDTLGYNEETGENDLPWTASEERTLEPIFNLKLKEVRIHVKNPLMILVGKLGLVHYDVYKDGLEYYMFCEIGYAQFGDVSVAMMPGEIVQDLVYGGDSLTADGSFSGKDFGYRTIRELFGKDTIVFGLCNDAIGYVVPDNDYSLGIADDHYQELVSLGNRTGSAIMQGFADLESEIR